MSDATDIQSEVRDAALIVCPQVKMLDDDKLKALSAMIDQNVGSASASSVNLVVIDLSHVQLLPSLALGLLVQISNKCKARQQKLKLAGVQPAVRQVFAITRLDRLFEFTPNVQAAMK